MKTTIYDLAKRANVSIATVSRALNPDTQRYVADKTFERINRLAEQLLYTPNFAARDLSRTTYNRIGVLVPHHPQLFLSDFYARALSGIADALLESDYQFKLVMLKPRRTMWDRHDFQSAESVDGLVVTHWRMFFGSSAVFRHLKLPAVIISDPEPQVHAHYVSGNHLRGGALAAEHLWAAGHRHIAVLTGPPSSADSRLRLRGFRTFLRQQGIQLNPHAIRCGEFQEAPAAEAAEALLRHHRPRITAFFCCNDNMAFGVVTALKKLGLRCPEDVSVVGYDNDHRCEHSDPPLTTVDVPLYDIARQATERLLQFLRGNNPKEFFARQTLLPITLIARQSVQQVD